MEADHWRLFFAGMISACIVVNAVALSTTGERRLLVITGLVFLIGIFLMGIEDIVEMSSIGPQRFHISGLATAISISALWPFISQLFGTNVRWGLSACLCVSFVSLYFAAHFFPVWHDPLIFFSNCLVLLVGGATALFVFSGRTDDMVESRLRLRTPFIAIIGVWTAVAAILGALAGLGRMPDNLALIDEAGLAVVVLSVTLLFTQAKPVLFLQHPQISESDHGRNSHDQELLTKLNQIMFKGRAWENETLTLGELADQLGVSDKRLRAAINTKMGFRNFSEFVNRHRVAEAKRLLTSDSHISETIASVAYASGFGSLGPFGRAFKAEVGMTPSEYRLAHKQVNAD